MVVLKIAILLLMLVGSALMLLWLFRPGSTKLYDEYSGMALAKDDDSSVSSLKSKDKTSKK